MFEDYPYSRTGQRWDLVEKNWLCQHILELGGVECARRLKRSKNSIKQQCYELGLIPRVKAPQVTYEDLKERLCYEADLQYLVTCKRQHLAKAILDLRGEVSHG